MGVQGLWDLASAAGQRVNFAALENKVVAVDASIWMYHFLKAMRDEKGDMVKGAHLLGFFRRICKLLYLKIRPVFVFDGPPPALKWKTLQLRAKQRDSEERLRRKAVERLLRNQLQQHLLRAAGDATPGAEAAMPEMPEDLPEDREAEVPEEVVEEEEAEAVAIEPGVSAPGRSRRRRGSNAAVPQPFRGFMAQRRGVSEVQLPQLPEEPLREILQVPNRRPNGRMRQPDEWKGYAVPGGGVVTVPLDGPVALEEFEQLDPKTKYMLLQRAQEAWYGESRLKAVEAKDDMGAFVNVQLEMFLRHIRTNKEIEKVKRSMAETVSRPVGEELAEGEVYRAPSFLQEQPQPPAPAPEAVEVDSVVGSKGRGKGKRRRAKRPRQLDGEPTRWQPLLGVQRSSDPLAWLGEEAPEDAPKNSEAPETATADCSSGAVAETAEDLFGAAFFEGAPGPSPQSSSPPSKRLRVEETEAAGSAPEQPEEEVEFFPLAEVPAARRTASASPLRETSNLEDLEAGRSEGQNRDDEMRPSSQDEEAVEFLTPAEVPFAKDSTEAAALDTPVLVSPDDEEEVEFFSPEVVGSPFQETPARSAHGQAQDDAMGEAVEFLSPAEVHSFQAEEDSKPPVDLPGEVTSPVPSPSTPMEEPSPPPEPAGKAPKTYREEPAVSTDAASAAEKAVAAAARAAPAAAPGRTSGGDADTSSLDGVWCSTHFQYRWRCKQDGVAHACQVDSREAAAPAGRSKGSKGKGKGKGDEEMALGDDEMEELEFQRLAAELEDEHEDLRAQARRAKRGADMVTPEMQADIEALLEALGIPFVHAPAEAEAQCAFLAEARLVDAVASDDSDVLVFGAREVYRRMFSEDQQVECYSSARLEARLGLLQDQLIVLAMLLGCDYTLGVHGVGIVNGLEIVRAYSPGRGSMGSVQEWLERLDMFRSWAQNVADWGKESAGVEDDDGRAMVEFKRKHTNFRAQWSFPDDFPSAAVMSAFQTPEVDRSLEAFSWASVDVQRVVAKLNEANLSEEKVMERLEPALRRYQDTLRQPRITEYLQPASGDVAVVRSMRMQEALRGLRGESPEGDAEERPAKGRRKGGRGRGRASGAAKPRARRGRGRGEAEATTFVHLQPGEANIDLDSDSA